MYTSKYGSTEQYAKWIAGDSGAEVRKMEEIQTEELAQYDTVICGGYLHMGKIVGVDFLQKNWDTLKSKRIGLFTVSAAPSESPEQQKWFEANVPPAIRAQVRHFPLQGRAMNLDFKDRVLVALPQTMLRLAYFFNHSAENKKAIDSFKPFDEVKKEYIASIVAFIGDNVA